MTEFQNELLKYSGVMAAAVAMVFVVAWRRKGHRKFLAEYAEREVCEHLKPAFELLRGRGHGVVRAGQVTPELPLELHMAPPWDPQAVYDELKMGEPVFVSERNVLFCKECLCELHPVRG